MMRTKKHTAFARYAASIAGILLLTLSFAMRAKGANHQTKHFAFDLSNSALAFERFSVDSLGQGRLDANPILTDTNIVPDLKLDERLVYRIKGEPVWQVRWTKKGLTLRSVYSPKVQAPPFVIMFDQKANHATLLGLMKPGQWRMQLPCVLHLPDMGSFRITGSGELDYDARRSVRPAFVRIAFPAATARDRKLEYRFEVAAIYPKIKGIERDPLYDGFRRDYLNIFQVNPRVQMLANNASSDPCSFTLFEYSDVALHTPPLVGKLTANDLIRMTLDRYLSGALGYGQIGYGCTPSDADLIAWKTPWTSLDTLPSLLITACNYVNGTGDTKWARANYPKLAAWGREMFASDKNRNGLIEYPGTGNYGDRPQAERRPANWWDCINFGHEDAFSNALAYRAGTMMTELARKLKHAQDGDFFADRAARLRSAYSANLLNPATGVIAGWKSADGQLHDYWFTYVQGMAVTFGLLDDTTANVVMDRLLGKMKEVGYTNFSLGLPGNLVPVKKGDYVYHETAPEVHGVPRLEDGSDGFQFYENGGATGCWTYYTIQALFKLRRAREARVILHPMLSGYARGEFQGFCGNGMSRDWRDWNGGCHGYEGLLVDNYHALLTVSEDRKRK